MTVEEILANVDLLYPNDVQQEHKWSWITQIDKLLLDECLLTHELKVCEERKAEEIAGMTTARRDYEPLAQPPYHDVYLHYIASKMAQINLDTDQYTNESALYNNALLTYKNMFNRTHRSKETGGRWRV